MKVIITEEQFKRVILKEQEVTASAADTLIEVVKDGVTYLYELQVLIGKDTWQKIKVKRINLLNKTLSYIHPFFQTTGTTQIAQRDLDRIKSEVGEETIKNIVTQDDPPKTLQLVLQNEQRPKT
tara:strand:+ start:106 stop:477 length:372 start_codon:yes stop_codon:yes gene_type:complete